MVEYTKQELEAALKAVNSMIHKCEKAQETCEKGSCGHRGWKYDG